MTLAFSAVIGLTTERRRNDFSASISRVAQSARTEGNSEMFAVLHRTTSRSAVAAIGAGVSLSAVWIYLRFARNEPVLALVVFFIIDLFTFATPCIGATVLLLRMRLERYAFLIPGGSGNCGGECSGNCGGDAAAMQSILRYTVLLLAVILANCLLGILPFLFFLSITTQWSLVVVPTAVLVASSLVTLSVWRSFALLADHVEMGRSASTSRSSTLSEETRTSKSVVWLMAKVGLVVAVIGCVYFLPFVVTAGPLSVIDEQDFYARQQKILPPGPSSLFNIMATGPLYGASGTLVQLVPVPTRLWPGHVSATMLLFALAQAASQTLIFISVPFPWIVSTASLVVVSSQAVIITKMIKKVRPQWHFTGGLAALSVLGLAILAVISLVILPAFSESESNDARLLYRLGIELTSFALSMGMQTFSRRFLYTSVQNGLGEPTSRRGSDADMDDFRRLVPNAPRQQGTDEEEEERVVDISLPFVAVAASAPISFIGRFMVASVDNLLAQLIAVIMVGVLDFSATCLAPSASLLIRRLRKQPSGERHSWTGAMRIASRFSASLPVAYSTVIRGALEVTSVLLVSMTIVVHALVWHDDIRLSELFLRLAASAAMQIAVVIVVELATTHVLVNRFNVSFTPIAATGSDFARFALVLGWLACITLAVAQRAFVVASRDIVVRFQH